MPTCRAAGLGAHGRREALAAPAPYQTHHRAPARRRPGLSSASWALGLRSVCSRPGGTAPAEGPAAAGPLGHECWGHRMCARAAPPWPPSRHAGGPRLLALSRLSSQGAAGLRARPGRCRGFAGRGCPARFDGRGGRLDVISGGEGARAPPPGRAEHHGSAIARAAGQAPPKGSPRGGTLDGAVRRHGFSERRCGRRRGAGR